MMACKKSFVLDTTEIEGRLDPFYYIPSKTIFFKKLNNINSIIKLKKLIKDGSYGVLPSSDSYNNSNPINYIRATEMKPDLKIDYINTYKVPLKYFSKRSEIKKGDILLAIKGATIASNKSVSFVDIDIENTIINGSIFKIRVNQSIEAKYLAYILNSSLCKQQMKYNLISNNGIDYLDKKLLHNLIIPLPPKEIQIQIVNIMDNAYKIKEEKEKRAKELLDSIDAYLLDALGIELPEIKEETTFSLDSSEVFSGRLDPFYYKKEFVLLGKELQKIPHEYLYNLSTKVIDGIHKTPKYSKNGLFFLQANNIKIGYIDFHNNIKYVSDAWKEEVLRRYVPQAGDVLITKDGTIGVSATVPRTFKDFSIFVSVMAIRPKDKIIVPEFLRIMISSSIVQQQILQSTKGAVISHLLIGEAKKLKIPLLSLNSQNKIVKHIESISYNAMRLKKEAKEILEKAKAEVENIILGED